MDASSPNYSVDLFLEQNTHFVWKKYSLQINEIVTSP